MSDFLQTAERVAFKDVANNYLYQRSALAYVEAVKHIGGKVLEVGTGEGYGIDILLEKASHLSIIDKFRHDNLDKYNQDNRVAFHQTTVPPFGDLPDNTFDAVVSFQVIEHIEDDHAFVAEAFRVLKPGGKMILTTPNKKMSLTRNPWHVREYTVAEFSTLIGKSFNKIDAMGVFGNEAIMEYYQKNKESVKRITRFDLFNLQYKLPRRLLQIPFDIANRLNRSFLHKQNTSLVEKISMDDYFVTKANDTCFDLFYIAQK